MSVKHAFTSAKSDGPDASLVRATNWNDDHTGTNDHGHTASGDGGLLSVGLTKLSGKTVNVTETVIAHGLSSTPTTVLVMPRSIATIWESSSPDGTNVYLTSTSGAVSVPNTTSPSGDLLVVTGQSETILNGCDLVIPLGASVDLAWTVWISQNAPGWSKSVAFRLRRTDLTGTVLASGSTGDSGDSTGGHQVSWVAAYSDSSPTDGRYVLTVQETGGNSSTQIWSDTRAFSLSTILPVTADVYVG